MIFLIERRAIGDDDFTQAAASEEGSQCHCPDGEMERVGHVERTVQS
jgi:hypothetical protein